MINTYISVNKAKPTYIMHAYGWCKTGSLAKSHPYHVTWYVLTSLYIVYTTRCLINYRGVIMHWCMSIYGCHSRTWNIYHMHRSLPLIVPLNEEENIGLAQLREEHFCIHKLYNYAASKFTAFTTCMQANVSV